ncbi:hypothetical protein X771_29700 [Mesorhizobium sp. LSJC277A00]|nr:hypothetical protein X771_29700 [Mesorhizobium sp. LSJC277A00]
MTKRRSGFGDADTADSRAAPATTPSFSAVAVSARYDRVPVLTRNTPFRDNDAKSQCFDKLEFYQ